MRSTICFSEVDRFTEVIGLARYAIAKQDKDAAARYIDEAVAKGPKNAEVFMARGSLEEVQAWAATDPFATAGAAEYAFIEVAPSILAPGLEALGQ